MFRERRPVYSITVRNVADLRIVDDLAALNQFGSLSGVVQVVIPVDVDESTRNAIRNVVAAYPMFYVEIEDVYPLYMLWLKVCRLWTVIRIPSAVILGFVLGFEFWRGDGSSCSCACSMPRI
ncbi:hypothetical protein ACP275_03G111700 [Erythranthe tilingii]